MPPGELLMESKLGGNLGDEHVGNFDSEERWWRENLVHVQTFRLSPPSKNVGVYSADVLFMVDNKSFLVIVGNFLYFHLQPFPFDVRGIKLKVYEDIHRNAIAVDIGCQFTK